MTKVEYPKMVYWAENGEVQNTIIRFPEDFKNFHYESPQEAKDGMQKGQETTPQEKVGPTHWWTREELEVIADKNGISGLRAIAKPLGIKGRGIDELIDEITAADWQDGI